MCMWVRGLEIVYLEKVYPAKTTKGIKTFPHLYYENNLKMNKETRERWALFLE